MRIIAGTAKGRKLLSVSTKIMVKPISDRMKQSLFDILKPKITAAYFLDLFAGTGAVGLEALSRGAQKAVFVDNNPACLNVVLKNCERFGFTGKARTVRLDLLGGVGRLKAHADEAGYDIIYMGTPYRDSHNNMLSYSGPVLKSIAEKNLLSTTGVIIIQHHKTENIPLPDGYEAFRDEKYGDTLISFYRRKKD